MIEVQHLTKHYGETIAVNNLSFQVKPGIVTGFLGPNGAGKSTTMRMMTCLDRPTSGSALIDGKRYDQFPQPLRKVGSVIGAPIHSGRSIRNHLTALASSNSIRTSRVSEVLEIVGLSSVVKKRGGQLSQGMRQRLDIATALLGDPEVLLFDEPVNGLDPEGVVWIRTLMKGLADEGRTVLVSSHLMSEMAMTADHLIVIGQGRLLADSPIEELIAHNARSHVVVRSPQAARLQQLLAAQNASVELQGDVLKVFEVTAETIGELALQKNVLLHELTPIDASLEEAFMDLTANSSDYRASKGQKNG